MQTTIQTYCPQSKTRCGVICHIENGRLVKVGKDPEHPMQTNLCPKGIASPELVYHPDRLQYPLKRTRPKSDPDPGWERISWSEALETIAAKLLEIKKTNGPEAVVFGKGASGGTPADNYKNWITRLALAFGSPNGDLGTTHICNWHKDKGSAYTYGVGIPVPDFARAECILIWGHNPAASWKKHMEEIGRARKRGARVIIVDPRRNETWREGDLWLPVRPGTDVALALGMLHVVLKEALYDKDFVRDWTNAPFLVREDTGKLLRVAEVDPASDSQDLLARHSEDGRLMRYDQLTKRFDGEGEPELTGVFPIKLKDGSTVKCRPVLQLLSDLAAQYPPERAAEITWVPADRIVEAARLFSNSKPACYYSYNGVEQHTVSMQNNRAICIFFALSGNFDKAGGNVIFPKTPTNSIDGKKEFKLDKLPLMNDTRPLGPKNVQARDVYRAVLEQKPYPVKALVSFGGNCLTANGDSLKGKQALEKIDFYVQVDLFETPVAQKADILLPAATAWESFYVKPSFEYTAATSSYLQLMPGVIPPLYESRPDIQIIFELAEKLGLADKFWNGDIEAAFNYQLAPSGVTVADLRKKPGGISLSLPVEYEKYRQEKDGAFKGFNTPSGRVELYSETFLLHGYDPLPEYKEPMISPISRPELAQKFPFVLSNFKLLAFCHGQHRGMPTLRKMVPHPYVLINREKAAELNIEDGEWVVMETPNGAIRVKAKPTDGIHPMVVSTQHGWWQGCKELDLPAYDPFSEQGANVNLLVSNDVADPITGSVPHKSYICNIRKA